MSSRHSVSWLSFGLVCFFANLNPAVSANDAAKIAQGRKLFFKEWVPGEKSPHGGDGLGPLYNARSCSACHHLGGEGGAGKLDTNVLLLTHSELLGDARSLYALSRTPEGFNAKVGEVERLLQVGQGDTQSVNRLTRSFLLHGFGVDKDYLPWKELVGSKAGWIGTVPTKERPRRRNFNAALNVSQRNSISLRGAGLIDSIPDAVLEAVAAEHGKLNSKARLARLPDGRIGRFGWKAQRASLADFTLTACAMELGLEVPGQAQASVPWSPDYRASGLDLNLDECNALTAYVGSLPAPFAVPAPAVKSTIAPNNSTVDELIALLDDPDGNYRRAAARELSRRGEAARPALPKLVERLSTGPAPVREAVATAVGAIDARWGERLFAEVGCARCHRPDLGQVKGIYSDLCLHEMGSLNDSGEYYGTIRSAPVSPGDMLSKHPERRPPSAAEWRTSPLWGCRDTAPYLHDGRAATLHDAITAHGGLAANYNQRTRAEQLLLVEFLKTIGAPPADSTR